MKVPNFVEAPGEGTDLVLREGLVLAIEPMVNCGTFKVKVPTGSYVVTVYLGDMTCGHDNVEVYAEGQLKLKGITNKAGEVKDCFFDVDVKDGMLELDFKDAGGGDGNWCCAGLIVAK